MTSKKRLVVVWDGRVYGGPNGVLESEVSLNRELIACLARERAVTLVSRSLDVSTVFTTVLPGVTVVNVGSWRGVPSPRVLLKTWQQLRQIGLGSVDLFLIGPGILPLLALLLSQRSSSEMHRLLLVNSFAEQSLKARAKRTLRSRSLVVLQASVSRLTHLISCRLATKVIAVSRDLALRYGASHVMPEIQWTSLERAQSSEREKINRDIDVLLAGRLEPEKGIVEAARRIVNSMPDLRVLIVGSGSLRSELASVLNSSTAEHLEGLSHEDLLLTMRRSRVVIVPSITEGFGLVAFEAATLGCVLVARPVGGLPEALADQRCIWFKGFDELSDAVSMAITMSNDHSAEMPSLEILRSRNSWLSPNDIIKMIDMPKTYPTANL